MTTIQRYDALREKYLHMAKRNNLTATTIANYESTTAQLRLFLQSRAEQGIIGDGYVSFDDIQAWIDFMTDAGNKASTIKQRLVTASQFFTFAAKPYIPADLRYAQSPVSPDFYPKVVTEQIEDTLPNEAVMALWDYNKKYRAAPEQFARNYCLVVLMLCTGLRNKEILDLTLADYDEHFRELRVRCGKGRKERIVDLPDLAIEAINNYLRLGGRPAFLNDDDYLFGTEAPHEYGNTGSAKHKEKWHRGTTAWLSQLTARHIEKQTDGQVKGCRTHALRHAFARLQLNATGNLAELQSAMGHTSPLVTERYSHRLAERRKREQALQVLAARDAAAEQLRSMNTQKQTIIQLYA